MNMPLISIVIPVYKAEKYLKVCLNSVLNQTYTNIEVILIDDGSPDNCPEICDEYALSDNRVKVIHSVNKGVSAARNLGIDTATGEWLAFIDSDDIVSNSYIETLVKHISSPKVLVCVGHYEFSDSVPKLSNQYEAIDICDFRDYLSFHGGYPWASLYNSEIINKYNLRFNESISFVEDMLWNFNYFCYSNKAVFLSNKLYYYRRHPETATSRCVKDVHSVVSSWLSIRNIGVEWYINSDLRKENIKTLKEFYRLCTNNVMSECVIAKYDYLKYMDIKNSSHEIGNFKRIVLVLRIEYLLEKYFLRLYYFLYKALYKLIKK